MTTSVFCRFLRSTTRTLAGGDTVLHVAGDRYALKLPVAAGLIAAGACEFVDVAHVDEGDDADGIAENLRALRAEVVAREEAARLAAEQAEIEAEARRVASMSEDERAAYALRKRNVAEEERIRAAMAEAALSEQREREAAEREVGLKLARERGEIVSQ